MSDTAHIDPDSDSGQVVVTAPWHHDLTGERVPLPSGGWVQLRHPSDLRSRHRKTIAAAITEDMTPYDVACMQQALAKVMITDWDLPYLGEDKRIPAVRTDNPLDDLTVADENRLIAALEPVLDLINPRPVTPDDHADPDSPTAPAAG